MTKRTTGVLPTIRGTRRAVPRRPSAGQAERLRELLAQDHHWVLRGDWEAYLVDGDPKHLVSIANLTRDHRFAIVSWLRQQRHALHEAVADGRPAPAGWLESLPLYKALTD